MFKSITLRILVLTIAAASWQPVMAEETPSEILVIPSGTRQPELPAGAGSRLDDAHRQAWEALTPQERQALWAEFQNAVGPELQQADQEYEQKRAAQAAAAQAATDPVFAPAPDPFRPVADALPPGTAGQAAPGGQTDTDASGTGKTPIGGKTPTGDKAPKPDNDGDGLPDVLERQLADNFTPAYFVSFFERGGTGLALFQDSSTMQQPIQVFPTSGPPVVTSYFRVTPLTAVGGNGYLQIDYLTLWNRDDGLPVHSACLTDIDIFDFLGIWSPSFVSSIGDHELDNERSAIRIVAPLTASGGFNLDPTAYRADRVFTAAHEDTPVDRSDFQHVDPPRGPVAHFAEFLSLSKHGTYLFWPHGLVSLLPGRAVAAIYGGVSAACRFTSPSTCDLLFYIADEIVFDCLVEKHAPQGWVLARSDLRVNVGEPGRPLPGGSFIETPELRLKLRKKFVTP